MFFALLLLLSIFLLDYLYYYQLLIGAVERGEAIEEGLPAAARLTTKLVAGVTFLMYMLRGLGTCA
jgi:hypothetical protein